MSSLRALRPLRDGATPFRVSESGCWIWTRARSAHGYAQRWVPERRRIENVHRLVYEEAVGPIPAGYFIDHQCDTRACVNPAHLKPVTNAVNCRRGKKAKLSVEIAARIRAEGPILIARQRELALQYGVSPWAIYDASRGRRWKP